MCYPWHHKRVYSHRSNLVFWDFQGSYDSKTRYTSTSSNNSLFRKSLYLLSLFLLKNMKVIVRERLFPIMTRCSGGGHVLSSTSSVSLFLEFGLKSFLRMFRNVWSIRKVRGGFRTIHPVHNRRDKNTFFYDFVFLIYWTGSSILFTYHIVTTSGTTGLMTVDRVTRTVTWCNEKEKKGTVSRISGSSIHTCIGLSLTCSLTS